MADVNANIGVNIDTSAALAQLKALQRQISQFHSSIARSSESAALSQKSLQKNLIGSINSIGAFSAELRTVRTSAESFTNSLEKNKFSMREYFRYAGASTKTFGKIFKTEFDTIGRVAEERVKTLQTQYIKMGRNATGAMEAIAIRPTSLNMQDYGTRTAIAAQKQALFNQLMKQGSTNLLNFGKNTQWAGRQLMVGFTIPLSIVGSAATKTFMEMEAQALKFRKVYGDLFTPKEETKLALDNITELGKQFTKYGIAVSQTVGLAAEAAAAGFQGLDLQRQTTEATRLSVLGQIDSQKALETTISLQNAFGMSSDKLADSINFLNAVENQTVVSLDDITTAIPKVAPVIQQLGGDVKDLTFFIAAMKEGGINASEGANALKSGLAALINPTTKASAMLEKFGINARDIVTKNKGNLKATVVEFATALNQLDPLNRAQAIEQMFGKFQFARLSTLFANVAKDGNQAARVLDLANASVEELSALSEQELGMTADSAMNKFKKSVEDLKVALVPVGKAFLEAATPIIEFVGGVLEKFGNLSDGTKRLITILTVGIGAVGPIFLMTFGLLANLLANAVKGAMILRQGYLRLSGQSQILGEQTQYLNTEQLESAAAAHSLDQSHAKLTQRFSAETVELYKLIAAYQSATRAAQSFAFNNPGMMMPTRGGKKLASGIVSVPGPKGAGDIVPAMLSPGEAVIPTAMAKKYAPLIQGMIADNIPGYQLGKGFKNATMFLPESINTSMGQTAGRGVPTGDVTKYLGGAGGASMAPLIAVIARELKVGINSPKFKQEWVNIGNTFAKVATDALDNSGKQFIKDIDLEQIVVPALREAAKGINVAGKEIDSALENAINQIRTVGPVGVGSGSMGGIGRTTFAGSYRGTRGAAQKFATEQNPSTFKQTERLSQSRGKNVRSFQTLNPMLNQWEVATMSHITSSVTASAQELTQRMTPYLGNVGEKITKAITKDITKGVMNQAKVASPSKETAKVGADIARGFVVGAQEYIDDAQRVGQRLGSSMAQTPSGLFVPGGANGGGVKSKIPGVSLGDVTARARVNRENLINLQQQRQSQLLVASTEKIGKFNSKIMGGSFALTSLAGVASMAGGNLGNVSQQIMKYSGLIFALMTVTQLLTQAKIAELAATRAGVVAKAMGSVTGVKGLFTSGAGFASFGKNLLTAGKFALRFAGPIGLVTSALMVGYGAYKFINNRLEENRKQLEAFGDAVRNSKEQIQSLGDYFGVVPTKTGLESTKPQIILDKNTRESLDKFKASDTFKEFASTIEAVSRLSDTDAATALKTKGQELLGKGFSKEQVSLILQGIQEEAGKTSLKIDFRDIDVDALNTELQTELGSKFSALPKFISDNLERKMVLEEDGRWYSKLVPGKKIEAELNNTGEMFKTYLNGLSGMFKNGIINGEKFNSTFAKTMDTLITQIPDAQQQTLLLNAALNQMDSELAKNAIQITNVKDKILLLQAAAVNATVSMAALGALRIAADDPKDVDAQIRAAAIRSDIAKSIAEVTKLQDIANKSLNNSYKDLNKTETKKAKTQLDVLKQAQEYIQLQEQLIDMQNAPKLKAYNDELERQEDLLKNINKQIDLITETAISPIEAKIKSNAYLIDQIAIKEDEINERYNLQIDALSKIRDINDEIAASEKEKLTLADALSRGDISSAAVIAQEARSRQAAFINERMQSSLTTSKDSKINLLGRNALEKENKQLQLDIAAIQKNQLEPLDLQKNAIQKNINAQNEMKSALEKTIETRKEEIKYLGLTKSQIDEAVKALDLAQNENIDIKSNSFLRNILKGALGDADALKLALDEVAKSSAKAFSTSTAKNVTASALGIPEQVSPKLLNDILSEKTANQIGEEARLKLLAESKKTGSDPFGAGAAASARYTAQAVDYYRKQIEGAMPKAMGGIIPKYYVSGGYSKGTDTIPAMLTPGEFVVRKNAVDSFGVNNLNKINDGSYGGSSVYNYSLSVNVKSDANPNDIARTVMTQIKQIDNQRIRTQRGA
jgi:TP901 family phage tail tape measure protein